MELLRYLINLWTIVNDDGQWSSQSECRFLCVDSAKVHKPQIWSSHFDIADQRSRINAMLSMIILKRTIRLFFYLIVVAFYVIWKVQSRISHEFHFICCTISDCLNFIAQKYIVNNFGCFRCSNEESSMQIKPDREWNCACDASTKNSICVKFSFQRIVQCIARFFLN